MGIVLGTSNQWLVLTLNLLTSVYFCYQLYNLLEGGQGWRGKSFSCHDRAEYKHDRAKLMICHLPMPFLLTAKRVCFAGCLVSHNDLFS